MSAARETIMAALLARLESAIANGVTANLAGGSAVVTGIPSTDGLFPGLPVAGLGIAPATFIQSVDSASQITLTQPAATTLVGATLSTAFRSTGRRVMFWGDVKEQPALFIRNVADHYQQHFEGMPARRTMNVQAWIYSNCGAAPDLVPGAVLNSLVDALEVAFQPDNMASRRLTLGGLVEHCWLEGPSRIDPGDIGPQAIAMVPISILIP